MKRSIIFIASLLVLGGPVYGQSDKPGSPPKSAPISGQHPCLPPQGCEEQQLPPELAGTPLKQVSNSKGDLKALNHGYEVDLSWTALPEGAKRVIIYRSTSSRGTWTKVGVWSV